MRRKELLPKIKREQMSNEKFNEFVKLLEESIDDDGTVEFVKKNHDSFNDRLWYNILN